MRIRLEQVVVDAVSPGRLVRFWAALLGGEPVDRSRGWSHVEPPGWPRISFQPVPEARSVKNRLHLDLDVDDIAAAVAAAVALDAVAVGVPVTDESGTGHRRVHADDPFGNRLEFLQPD